MLSKARPEHGIFLRESMEFFKDPGIGQIRFDAVIAFRKIQMIARRQSSVRGHAQVCDTGGTS